MNINKNYWLKPESYSLAAGASQNFHAVGRSLTIIDLTGSVSIGFDEGPLSPLVKGFTIDLEEDRFSKLRFVETSGTTSGSVDFAISVGKITDNRNVVVGAVPIYAGDTVETPAAVTVTDTATLIVAATTDELFRMFQNQGASNAAWIGDANVDPANNRGIKVSSSETLTLGIRGAVYGRCESSLSTTISVLKGVN